MKIDILTLFPAMFEGILNESIIKRAISSGIVDIKIHDIRSYSNDPHKKVDDYGYGGGAGMVLMIQPIYDAINDLKTDESLVIMMTPQGIPYKQNMAKKLTEKKHIILLCGHYEGFDERIRNLVDMEISVGDYVLTGGEIPSMIVIDSVIRLLPGVINHESHELDSFQEELLDYPVYTHPYDFMGMKVPDVLLSGHHENISKWRKQEQIKRTKQRRPDLLEKRNLDEK